MEMQWPAFNRIAFPYTTEKNYVAVAGMSSRSTRMELEAVVAEPLRRVRQISAKESEEERSVGTGMRSVEIELWKSKNTVRYVEGTAS
jgi:hypothetical protein